MAQPPWWQVEELKESLKEKGYDLIRTTYGSQDECGRLSEIVSRPETFPSSAIGRYPILSRTKKWAGPEAGPFQGRQATEVNFQSVRS